MRAACRCFTCRLRHKAVAGALSSQNAASVIAYIDRAVDLALAGEARAMVTAPIQKETLYQAGFAMRAIPTISPTSPETPGA